MSGDGQSELTNRNKQQQQQIKTIHISKQKRY